MILFINTIILSLSALHIGRGYIFKGTKEPVLKEKIEKITNNQCSIIEQLVIPGSTVKGVLRTASYLAANYLKQKGINLESCGAKDPGEIRLIHKKMGLEQCDTCMLFGMPDHPGLLEVSLFRPAKDLPSITLTTTKISIDPYSLKSAEGALYVREETAPGLVFSGEIKLDLNVLGDRKCTYLLLLLTSMKLVEYVGMGRMGTARMYIKGMELIHNNTKIRDLDEILNKLGCKEEIADYLKKIYAVLQAPQKIDFYEEIER